MADKRISAAEIRRVWLDPTLTTAEAARAVGLARSNLWRRAKALGLPPRKAGRMFAITDRDRFGALWLARVRARDIAEEFGAGFGSVVAMAGRLGLPRRAPGTRVMSMRQYREGLLGQAMSARAPAGEGRTFAGRGEPRP